MKFPDFQMFTWINKIYLLVYPQENEDIMFLFNFYIIFISGIWSSLIFLYLDNNNFSRKIYYFVPVYNL